MSDYLTRVLAREGGGRLRARPPVRVAARLPAETGPSDRAAPQPQPQPQSATPRGATGAPSIAARTRRERVVAGERPTERARGIATPGSQATAAPMPSEAHAAQQPSAAPQATEALRRGPRRPPQGDRALVTADSAALGREPRPSTIAPGTAPPRAPAPSATAQPSRKDRVVIGASVPRAPSNPTAAAIGHHAGPTEATGAHTSLTEATGARTSPTEATEPGSTAVVPPVAAAPLRRRSADEGPPAPESLVAAMAAPARRAGLPAPRPTGGLRPAPPPAAPGRVAAAAPPPSVHVTIGRIEVRAAPRAAAAAPAPAPAPPPRGPALSLEDYLRSREGAR